MALASSSFNVCSTSRSNLAPKNGRQPSAPTSAAKQQSKQHNKHCTAAGTALPRRLAGSVLLRCAPPDAPPPFLPQAPTEEDVRQKTAAAAVPLPKPVLSEAEHCDYYSSWWPVMPAADLDPKRPLGVSLLGMSLVLWCDKQGAWHCFQDRCPHRLAPLSEGVVQGDRLMCTYHGWEFSKAGKCEAIPQIEDPKALATACASTRNCVQAYPAKVEFGLLWVYPKPGAQGASEASAKPTMSATLPSMVLPPTTGWGAEGPVEASGWFMRELPLRYETVLENIMDLSHVPYAHHNGTPFHRTDKPKPGNAPLSVPEDRWVTPQGFHVRRAATPGGMGSITWVWEGPGHLCWLHGEGMGSEHFFVVPTRPGWSQIYICSVLKGASLSKTLLGKAMQAFPVLRHLIFRHQILDGDLLMLHLGERSLLADGNDTRSSYYLPANADLPVVMWRKWLAKHAPVVPTCTKADEPLMPPAMPKDQLLDRWYQHTRHCKSCQGALKALDRGVLAAQVVGALAVLATLPAVATGAWPLASAPAITGAVLAALSAAVYKALMTIRPSFFFLHYDQTDHYHKA